MPPLRIFCAVFAMSQMVQAGWPVLPQVTMVGTPAARASEGMVAVRKVNADASLIALPLNMQNIVAWSKVRHTVRVASVAERSNAPGCRPGDFGLRGFESLPAHLM